MPRILVVDDEPTLVATLRFNLEREGFDVVVASDGGEVLELVERYQPDLVLLDLMLPGMHGFEVCRALRKRTAIPIVILSARADEVDRIVGLEVGADDYITKPFSMVELIARLRALLRRSAGSPVVQEADVLAAGPLAVDLDRREVMMNGELLRLNPKEFDLLVTLMQNRGQTLTRDQLLRKVWKYDTVGYSRTVDVHIGRLRRKIERDPNTPVRIITVRPFGYRLDG
jgi:two-component system, OmpR family, response regulator RegX3